MDDAASPYAAFPAAEPAEDSLARISRLAKEADEAKDDLILAEEELKLRKEVLRRLVEKDLPDAMTAVGLSTFTTTDGLKITLKDELQVKQPPVAQRAAAYRWLEEHGQGGLVKRAVEIAFGAGEREAERAHALMERLGLDFPGSVRESQDVHTGTLKAFLSRALEDGESPPLELFGARSFKAAKIERKK